MEPQTLDEYRNLTQAQKRQISKLEKKNAELAIRLTERSQMSGKELKSHMAKQAIIMNKSATKVQALARGFIQRRRFKKEIRKIAAQDTQAKNLINTYDAALQEIKKIVGKMGLTLEMLFRACDQDNQGVILIEDFKVFLKNIGQKKLNLSLINRFLHAIDEDCSGQITKEEYYDCLQAYGVNSERSGTERHARTFEQESMLRFAALLHEKDISPNEVYQFCDSDGKGFANATSLTKFISTLNEPFHDKEVFAIITFLDVQNNRRIPKNHFLTEIEKAIGLATKENIPSARKQYSPFKSPQKQSARGGNFSEFKPVSEFKGNEAGTIQKNKIDRISGTNNNQQQPRQPRTMKQPTRQREESEEKKEKNSIKKIIVKMELENKPIYQFLEKLLLGIDDPRKGLMAPEVLNKLEATYGRILDKTEKMKLVKYFDHNLNGTIDVYEIQRFFINMSKESKEKILTANLFAISFAKQMDYERIGTEDFFKKYNILMSDPPSTMLQFCDSFIPILDWTEEVATDVFKEIDTDSKGYISTGDLIKLVNQFRNDEYSSKSNTQQTIQKPASRQPTAQERQPRLIHQQPHAPRSRDTSEEQKEKNSIKKIIVKMELENKPIYQFLEELLENEDTKRGMMVPQILNMIERAYGKILDKTEKMKLVKYFDHNLNGTIDVYEIQRFFINMSKESKEKILTPKLLFLSLARQMEYESIGTEEFFEKHDILSSDEPYTQFQFVDQLTPIFDLLEEASIEIFKEMKSPEGTVSAAHIIKYTHSLRNDKDSFPLGQSEKKPQGSGGYGQQIMKHFVTGQVQEERRAKKTVAKRAIVKLELNDTPIHQLLEQYITKMINPKIGATVHELRAEWKPIVGDTLTKHELDTLIDRIDCDKDGTINILEIRTFLTKFLKRSKEQLITLPLFEVLVARLAQIEMITTKLYLQNKGIKVKEVVKFDEFAMKLGGILRLKPPQAKELLSEWNWKETGTVEIDEFIAKINKIRTDVTSSGKIDYKYAIQSVITSNLLKMVVDPEEENQAREKFNQVSETISGYNDSLRQKGFEPLAFWAEASKGKSICHVAFLQKALQVIAKVSTNQAEIKNQMRIFDTDGNGSIEQRDYELMVLDTKGFSQYQKLHPGGKRPKEDIDQDAIEKVKMALAIAKKTPEDLYSDAQRMSGEEVDVLEIESSLATMAPYSKLSFNIIIRFLRSLDTQYNGIIKEEDYYKLMGGESKAAATNQLLGNMLGLQHFESEEQDQGLQSSPQQSMKSSMKKSNKHDPRAEIMNPSKIQSIGPSQDNEVKDALLKLKDVLFNRRAFKSPNEMFKQFDKNNDGQISREEFIQGLDNLDSKVFLTERQKVLLLTSADRNRDNRISYDEFINFIKSLDISQAANASDNNRSPATGVKKSVSVRDNNSQNLDVVDTAIAKLKTYAKERKNMLVNFEYTFNNADANGDGMLNKTEFYDALNRLEGVKLSTKEKETIYTLADIDEDGYIRLDEFFSFLKTYEIPGSVNESRNDESKDQMSPLKMKRSSSKKKTRQMTRALSQVNPHDKQAAEEAFDKYMKKKTLKKEDFFNGKETILNDAVSCLKKCHEIVKEMKKNNTKKWIDPDFGPQPNDSDKHGKSSLYFEDRPPGYPDEELIEWCRTNEIIGEGGIANFLDEGAKTNDVIQGEIGDCWLIGAFSVLATQDKYIVGDYDLSAAHNDDLDEKEAEGMQIGLYCPMFHYLKKYGIYVIRFFKNYGWRYVIIDDRLPAYQYEGKSGSPDLVFGKCRNLNEFWVPLLEKAYAKLHNTYEALIAGYLDDALTDMTGLVSYKYKLHGKNGFPSPQVGSADELWAKLLEYRENNTMMGCSVQGEADEVEHEVMIDDQPAGILKNHAYAIIDVLEIPNPTSTNQHKSHRLLRIRNPWGNKEWNGKWSDGSVKLLQNIKRLNEYIKNRAGDEYEEFDPEADDGTFLMCYKDWRNTYHNLFCCINFPEEWSGIRFVDEWTDNNSGGTPLRASQEAFQKWASNPQYSVEIKKTALKPGKNKTSIFISLGQADGRMIHGLKFPFKENINPVCFTVARLGANQETLPIFDQKAIVKLSPIKEYREVALDLQLEPGKYVIVPSCQREGMTGQFFLNIYHECDKKDIKVINARTFREGEPIQEEEEGTLTTDKDLRRILRFKAIAALDENQLDDSILSPEKARALNESRDSGTKQEKQSSPQPGGGFLENKIARLKSKGMTMMKQTLLDFDPDEAQKHFHQIMKSITITKKDYFREGCTTILNSNMTALKRCYELLEDMHKKKEKRFTDPDFGGQGPEDTGLSSIINDVDCVPYWVTDPDNLRWVRKKQLAGDEKAYFLSGGAESGDVIQGEIGDCWFIGALSVISQRDELIRGKFNPSTENLELISDEEVVEMTTGIFAPMFHWLRRYGIYVLRFFKNYAWRYVIIDDTIPCYQYDDPRVPTRIVFAKCRDQNEFWVPLIEKAYAKLHNTYEALVSGYLDDGLSDMTGMAQDKFKIPQVLGSNPSHEKKDQFWKRLMEAIHDGSMMGCSIQAQPGETEHELTVDGERMGILKGHAYSIIDVFELSAPEAQNYHKSHRLLRIRNPWGNKEWNGKWSDKSDKFKKLSYKIEKYMTQKKQENDEYEILDVNGADDGTFLMCYRDWREYFSNLVVAIDFPPDFSGRRFYGEWTTDQSGGFPTKNDVTTWAQNPQFLVTLKKTTQIFISLGQDDGRLVKGEKFHFPNQINPVMVMMMGPLEKLKPMEKFDQSKMLLHSTPKEYKEVSCQKEFPPGDYVIVPCCAKPGMTGKYYLNIYFNCQQQYIKTEHMNGSYKWEEIAEEEEDVATYDEKTKFVMRYKASDVIYKVEDQDQKKIRSLTDFFKDK